ncbi:MAG: ribulose-phosphate 3-epimerase [Patescibacteria group bacterium]|jgi:ribulose-phosphate 3-epimerase|nr:ribulose-phosphate 3-epimerase [Patescibacteria group bacterium]
MTSEIIAAILTSSPAELNSRLAAVSGLVRWAQLDVMDGQFVNNVSADLNILEPFNYQLKISAHLMVDNPVDYFSICRRLGCQRLIFHYEAVQNHHQILAAIKAMGLEAGLALEPQTDIKVVSKFLPELSEILLLAVDPGLGGQLFMASTLDRIKALRQLAPDQFISVDGGINSANIKTVADCGANGLVVGSAIFMQPDIKQAIKDLEQKLHG